MESGISQGSILGPILFLIYIDDLPDSCDIRTHDSDIYLYVDDTNMYDCTLHTRLSGKTELGAKPGHPTKLSFNQEQKLVDYAGNRAQLGVGFGKGPFMLYASKFAQKHGTKFLKGIPSEHRWCGMKKPELKSSAA